MSPQERDILAKKITNLAFFYGKTDLTKASIVQMIDGFDYFFEKDFKSYCEALDSYSKDKSNRFFPSLAQLGQYLNSYEADPKQEAHEIAQRAFAAISNFGYTKGKEAKEFIGPIGWQAINQRGGWQWFCETTMVNDIPMLVSQMREGIISEVIKFRQNKNKIVEQIEYKEPPKEIKTERQNEVEFIQEIDPELRKKLIREFMLELKSRQVGVNNER